MASAQSIGGVSGHTTTRGNQVIGRKAAVIGLALLSALFFTALAAQSASAAFVKAKNTTAFTCVKGGGKKDFKDPHCDEKVEINTGEYGHVAIPNDETTEIEVTSKETANKTTEGTSSTLKGTLAGAALEIICETASTSGAAEKSFIHNVETEKGVHTVTGTAAVVFSGCKVIKPLNCTVKNIEVKSLFEGVEKGGPKEDTMGVQFRGDPEGAAFATITLEGEKCALKGTKFEVKGTAIGTGTPTPNLKHSGATLKFEPGNEMETLEIGGKVAEFTGTFTTRMAEIEKVKQNPISLTTTPFP